MTPPLAEAKTISPQVVKKSSNATIDLTSPKPVGFNGGSTETGIKKTTIVPVFSSLGELKVTSLPTSENGENGNNEIYAGTKEKTCQKTCGQSCGGTCNHTCPHTCSKCLPPCYGGTWGSGQQCG